MRVYIAQLKCPSNHCILGAAGEFESMEEAQSLAPKLESEFEQMVAEGTLNRKCELCGSTMLSVAVDRTKFATMAEAKPYLQDSERMQALTAAMIKRSRN